LKVFDFQKNTYQFEINFRLDCLSTNTILGVVEHLIKRKVFSSVLKGEAGSQAVLRVGEGVEKSPYFQLTVGRGVILLSAGWYVSYERWQKWRNDMLTEVTAFLKDIPTEMVGVLTSQAALTVPNERVKDIDEIPELEPVLALYRRFVPRELLKRASAYVALGDENQERTIEWWAGGSTTPGEESVTFRVHRNVIDPKVSLGQNAISHATSSDELLEKFHTGFLALIIKT
jgi:hypothetical protein